MNRWFLVPLAFAVLGVGLLAAGFAIQASDARDAAQCTAAGGIACGIGAAIDRPYVAELKAAGLAVLVASAAVALWLWSRPEPARDRPADPQS